MVVGFSEAKASDHASCQIPLAPSAWDKIYNYMIKTVQLSILGTYTDKILSTLPNVSGLYFVYKEDENGLKKLLYIGEAENINNRLNGNHEKRREWNLHLLPGEQSKIVYLVLTSQDVLSPTLRRDVENACIFKVHPPLNTQGKSEFSYSGIMQIVFKGIVPDGFERRFIMIGWYSKKMNYLRQLFRRS